jgi:hypothetical protein
LIHIQLKIYPVNHPFDPIFEPFWFNSKEYAKQQVLSEGYTFVKEEGLKQLFIRLYKKDNELISPGRASFGGIEFSNKTNAKEVFEFTNEIIDKARSEGIEKITITSFPECYDINKADIVDEVLLKAGFQVTITELNYHLDMEMGDFETFIKHTKREKILRCGKAGFECLIETNSDYKQIHKLISDCRLRKGYPLSMNVEDFEKMFKNFPQQYLIFVVKDKALTIAVAIGVKVRSDILYIFLLADHEEYLDYSPAVLLHKRMYDYCCENGYKIFDLGIASYKGLENEGLVRFKRQIGGKFSHKYSYEINLGKL